MTAGLSDLRKQVEQLSAAVEAQSARHIVAEDTYPFGARLRFVCAGMEATCKDGKPLSPQDWRLAKVVAAAIDDAELRRGWLGYWLDFEAGTERNPA